MHSRRVLNDEPELLTLFGEVLDLDEDVVWAVDAADGIAALWINVLLNHGRHLVYIPGLALNRASAGCRGMGRTDAMDATVITDQVRMRRDLAVIRPDDEHVIELRILSAAGLTRRPTAPAAPTGCATNWWVFSRRWNACWTWEIAVR